MSKTYPYQNRSLKDIKGEKWEDIPGLDGYFLISSFGRIKRMEREQIHSNGFIQTIPEKILATKPGKLLNKFIGDYIYQLTGCLRISNRSYSFSIKRLVYCCFVKEFALDDSLVEITTKNGNGLDIRPGNLKMIKAVEKTRIAFDKGRAISQWLFCDRSNAIRARMAVSCKEVSQYDQRGILIKTYSSIMDASRSTGIDNSGISRIARGHGYIYGGFYWRYGAASKIEVEEKLTETYHKNLTDKIGVKVTQYDLSGKKLGQYPSMVDAQIATGTSAKGIKLMLKGIYKTAGGCFWKKGYGEEQIDLSGYKWGSESASIWKSKKVEQYTPEGKFIRSFNSLQETASIVQVTAAYISLACKGNRIYKGYRWRFAK
ncbi:NUMOD1 domain-containing protein [Chitinophaga sp. YR573]|uniref:NUMOD1 domain-containing DNA-binding protein n=1 Tax=Chitinophaga sp. YR573 TaxID=1881040 RepID=UPI0008B6FF9D|nr:NUMOD1 domain-containing DNA-binding protein [Chitinophaga sp. YR573]SEW46845.1 NUMOD1 domain-containing protein [Chitinophaga sp. YR573]